MNLASFAYLLQTTFWIDAELIFFHSGYKNLDLPVYEHLNANFFLK